MRNKEIVENAGDKLRYMYMYMYVHVYCEVYYWFFSETHSLFTYVTESGI